MNLGRAILESLAMQLGGTYIAADDPNSGLIWALQWLPNNPNRISSGSVRFAFSENDRSWVLFIAGTALCDFDSSIDLADPQLDVIEWCRQRIEVRKSLPRLEIVSGQ